MLSPCVRQVTHALLTRPPLSHFKILSKLSHLKCFVRLACVKHAASVHPEPGSNSHVQKVKTFKFILPKLIVWLLLFLGCDFIQITSSQISSEFSSDAALRAATLKNFQGCITVYLSKFILFHFRETNGEGGIWTLAPLLTTCTLSRGVPSTSWVLLQLSWFIEPYLAVTWKSDGRRDVSSGESGIRTHAPFRTNGFQDRLVMTTSISLQAIAARFAAKTILAK